jgi:hypothetical protein
MMAETVGGDVTAERPLMSDETDVARLKPGFVPARSGTLPQRDPATSAACAGERLCVRSARCRGLDPDRSRRLRADVPERDGEVGDTADLSGDMMGTPPIRTPRSRPELNTSSSCAASLSCLSFSAIEAA